MEFPGHMIDIKVIYPLLYGVVTHPRLLINLRPRPGFCSGPIDTPMTGESWPHLAIHCGGVSIINEVLISWQSPGRFVGLIYRSLTSMSCNRTSHLMCRLSYLIG